MITKENREHMLDIISSKINKEGGILYEYGNTERLISEFWDSSFENMSDVEFVTCFLQENDRFIKNSNKNGVEVVKEVGFSSYDKVFYATVLDDKSVMEKLVMEKLEVRFEKGSKQPIVGIKGSSIPEDNTVEAKALRVRNLQILNGHSDEIDKKNGAIDLSKTIDFYMKLNDYSIEKLREESDILSALISLSDEEFNSRKPDSILLYELFIGFAVMKEKFGLEYIPMRDTQESTSNLTKYGILLLKCIRFVISHSAEYYYTVSLDKNDIGYVKCAVSMTGRLFGVEISQREGDDYKLFLEEFQDIESAII